MSLPHRMALGAALLAAAVLVVLTACNGDGSSPAQPTTVAQSLIPVTRGRDPVERSLPTPRFLPTLDDVQTLNMGPFDRVIFYLGKDLPSFRVEYVSPPFTACGSGQPVEVAGKAFLQVRMSPAAAHDDQGNATFDQQELTPNLPTLVEMQQTCDFEGELTWVIGLREEVDFRVNHIGRPFLRNLVAIDLTHP